ncbi:cysteine synthase A [Lactococcus cremoris]|uniref:Cysteine synthase n=1 Tax=Lactococcus lactis subsp. cremoris TaxID=1359 RepID=A0AAD1JYU4_LACLC|nr:MULTISPECIES: cysteine synthase A [Lactococcus]ARE17598.1 cysteine synthase A [Lactococcus cremoris]ARE25358.1 cysteine synthase A [Lactococcus cremoris]AXN64743.1 cysteine synthase [Lactococcus cremoris]EUN33545.1 cysteine synthase A CysK [Lactococcus cremoris subsp. cremoris HP]MBU8903640.1 cysteine synthase A [Lactococcus cremoris]
MTKIYENITELIGHTPIIKLQNVPADSADVYVKLEAFNPGGSVKDRIALSMIRAAEADGRLQAGGTIVEPTSGNTGIGLAFVGSALGYKVVIVMPESFSLERRKLIQAYGAKLVLTPASGGMKAAIAKAKELSETEGYFLAMQFENPANPEVYEKITGAEIIDAFGPTGLDAFVAGAGTGGTITGVSHALKKVNPNIKTYVVEADESAILSGEPAGPHKIQGISAGFIPGNLDTKSYDEIIRVKGEDAILIARHLGGKEGFLVGISSGAAIYAALEVAKKLGKGKKVLAIAPDNGERYLSTALYDFDSEK